jgi:hypothetical protein
MKLPTTPKKLHIPNVLEEIYSAQDLMASKTVNDLEREQLRRAVDSAISVVVIYLKLGREPRVMEKHFAGIDKLRKVLERHGPTC